jgi:glutamine synthetase
MSEIRRCLDGFGMPVESSQTEYGPGQFEVNIGPSDPIRAADDTAIFKHVVKEVARRHGLRATFMPCPFPGAVTSGMHVHQSLQPAGSQPLSSYVAGVLQRLPELTAIFSPTINSYKRAADYSFAANRACWGFDNRTVAVRVLDPETEGARVEVRTASSEANPYLVTAGCLAAGASGIQSGAEPPPPVEGDAYKESDPAPLPRSLAEALPAFGSSRFVGELLGAPFVETFQAIGEHELEMFNAHVTDWERERYREPS